MWISKSGAVRQRASVASVRRHFAPRHVVPADMSSGRYRIFYAYCKIINKKSQFLLPSNLDDIYLSWYLNSLLPPLHNHGSPSNYLQGNPSRFRGGACERGWKGGPGDAEGPLSPPVRHRVLLPARGQVGRGGRIRRDCRSPGFCRSLRTTVREGGKACGVPGSLSCLRSH